jgi:hypothetical protein
MLCHFKVVINFICRDLTDRIMINLPGGRKYIKGHIFRGYISRLGTGEVTPLPQCISCALFHFQGSVRSISNSGIKYFCQTSQWAAQIGFILPYFLKNALRCRFECQRFESALSGAVDGAIAMRYKLIVDQGLHEQRGVRLPGFCRCILCHNL